MYVINDRVLSFSLLSEELRLQYRYLVVYPFWKADLIHTADELILVFVLNIVVHF